VTTAALPHPLSETPPKDAGETGAYVVVAHHYPMRTQRRPLRVAYAVAPDAFAVAALSDALAATVANGIGLALLLDAERAAVGGSAVGAGAALDGEGGEDGAGAAVITAVSGHSRSSK